MFCTGGIRCEKSTAYLKALGFENVYHLEGGILKYFETVPTEESMWDGECFVFDNRVSVNQELERGKYDQCSSCRYPLTAEDKTHAHFEAGVSCPHCYADLTEGKRASLAERQKQIELAKKRGEVHIGGDVHAFAAKHRREKLHLKDEARLASGVKIVMDFEEPVPATKNA